MKEKRIFNNIPEISIRILVILLKSSRELSVQRIIYYDYLVVHLGDVDSSMTSLHPANPTHISELLVKRDLIKESINFLIFKGLIDIGYANNGINYCINNSGKGLLAYFESIYFNKLISNAKYLDTRFGQLTDEELSIFINENLGKFTGEFERNELWKGK